MKKIISYITMLAISIISIANFTPVFASGINCSGGRPSDIPVEVWEAAGCSGTDDALPVTIVNILNAIIGVAGLVAVIFIIIGSVQYMTSSGDSAKTKKGKDTILYACIGLIICVLSFAIVNFVISNIIKDNPSNHTTSTSCINAGFNWDSANNKCTR